MSHIFLTFFLKENMFYYTSQEVKKVKIQYWRWPLFLFYSSITWIFNLVCTWWKQG